MFRYILDRFLTAALTVFLISSLAFFVMKLTPDGPFSDARVASRTQGVLSLRYGLDLPLHQQYGLFLKNIVRGDLGLSMIYSGREVSRDIGEFFPNTLRLNLAAGLLAFAGALVAYGRGAPPVVAALGVSVPGFALGALLLVAEARLGWLPRAGAAAWQQGALPVLALSAGGMWQMLRRLQPEGPPPPGRPREVRGVRAVLLALAACLGPLAAGLLTEGLVIEKMFSVSGLGADLARFAARRDDSVMMGLAVFYCAVMAACNFLGDVLRAVLDPRVRRPGGPSGPAGPAGPWKEG